MKLKLKATPFAPPPLFKVLLVVKFFIAIVLIASVHASAKSYLNPTPIDRTITGIIKDENGDTMPGVSVVVKGTSIGAQTDSDGKYTLSVPDNAVLVITFIGYTPQEIVVGAQTTINVALLPDIKSLDEVVVVAYGVQRKESVVSAISTVDPKVLRSPTGNLTNALAGRVAGIIAYQQSGEPGNGTDNSAFYIRGLASFGTGKQNPLIMIDNMESTATDMARLQTDDIASFSVLKDASAAAIYGARGANGVILITTKLGNAGATQFSFRIENTLSTNTRNYKLVNNIDYMRDANEAALTRHGTSALPYNENKINHTIAGDDPYLYPNNNWLNKMVKDYTINQRYNLNISGGTGPVKFYIAGTYNRDNGILKSDPNNNYNSNIKLDNYSIRSNTTLSITKTTEVIIRMYGQFDDYNGPIGSPDGKASGGGYAFNNALASNPVSFPAVYPKSKLPYLQHALFGSAETQSPGSLVSSLYKNPYAEMVAGHQNYKSSNIQPQIEVKQDLDFLVRGLTASAMAYLQRNSSYKVARAFSPFYYAANRNPSDPKTYSLSVLNDGTSQNFIGTPGQEYLSWGEFPKVVNSKMYVQGSLNYARVFNSKHAVSGLLTGFISSYEAGNSGSLTQSLPQRNSVTAGRFTYGYDNRYLLEVNFGYNGSERFAKNHRFGFFPSAAVGYVISNEKYFESLKETISNLKLRASYGLVGNDQIGKVEDRFFYLSIVNPNNIDYQSRFGLNNGSGIQFLNGYSVNRYGNTNITWELSRQINLGLDLSLFNSLNLTVEAFKSYRSNILLDKSIIESAQGLTSNPQSNYGKGESKGIDLTLNYTKSVSHDFSFILSGTFTYATNKITKYDEVKYDKSLSYLSRTGHSFDQRWGLVAERLFVDKYDVENSPKQSFASFPGSLNTVQGGDIKYKDINEDGIVNYDDFVPIGYPTKPEIIYGIGPSLTYKKIDFGFMFQGSARSTFFISPLRTSPFFKFNGYTYNDDGSIDKTIIGGNSAVYQNGELQAIHDSHWTEENPDPYAFWPRLSPELVNNNIQQSTWWMRKGSFIRLKTVTLGYSFSALTKRFPLKPRLYFSATNLFAISSFKLWDVEMGGNGLGYPVQAVYMIGLQTNL